MSEDKCAITQSGFYVVGALYWTILIRVRDA
jgi:hypothetical protein